MWTKENEGKEHPLKCGFASPDVRKDVSVRSVAPHGFNRLAAVGGDEKSHRGSMKHPSKTSYLNVKYQSHLHCLPSERARKGQLASFQDG